MKRIKLVVFILIIIFITSCSIPSDFYEKYDGVPFEKIDSFKSDGTLYDLLIADETTDSLAYYYKTIDNKSSKETWIINYSDQADYISESFINDDLYANIFDVLKKNEMVIENRIHFDISLYPNEENIILEEVLKNDFKEEVGCIIIGQYLPIIVSNSKERYLIFIPINAYICIYKDNVVYNFMEHEKISIEELVNKYKILER